MKIYIKSSEDIQKYGIFHANAEISEKDFNSAWDIVDADSKVEGPIEVFNTLEEANRVLAKKYHTTLRNERLTGGRIIWGDVYFTAEVDENGYYDACYNVADGELSMW